MDSDDLLNIGQAAKFLNVSETSLRRWTNAGLLPCLRVGGRQERRFRRADLLAFIRGSASGIDSETEVAGLGMPLGTHLCGLYSTDDGQASQAAGFLVDGVGPGRASFIVGAPDTQQAVLARLEERRPSIRREVAAGRLVLLEYADSALHQWEYWEAQMRAALRCGVHTLRVVGDLQSLRTRVSRDEVIEYEAGYDERIARKFPVVTLCQYDVRRFSTLELLDALKSHRDTFRYPAERVLA
jgi:transcriptional repressor of dcmA and dcmR